LLMEDNPKALIKEISVTANCYAVNKKIVDLGFPKHAIIAMIRRDNKYVTPNGSTVIEDKDILVVLADKQEAIENVKNCLNK
ncbi:MAG: TrkA C-terminal domain-containing protein, partial [Cellulophaga sp.]